MTHNVSLQRENRSVKEDKKSKEVKSSNEQPNRLAESQETADIEMNLEEQEKPINQNNHSNTSRLDHLDLSYLAEKRIEPVKQRNKVERLKELREAKTGEDLYNSLINKVFNILRNQYHFVVLFLQFFHNHIFGFHPR